MAIRVDTVRRVAPLLFVLGFLGPLGLLGVAGPVAAQAGGSEGAQAAATATVERTLYLMGTRAELRVEATDRAAALAASEAAVQALEASEARLSTWAAPAPGGPAGELARLNRAPVGEPIALSPRLADELRRAEDCRRATGGAFDPGVGALVAAWGLRDGGRVPTTAEISRALEADGGDLELDSTPRGVVAVRRAGGLVLDEGAWGKGAGLDSALAALDADPTVLAADLDLGGQVAVLRRSSGAGATASTGPPSRAADLADLAVLAVLDLADPRDRERVVARIEIPSGSVATSGNSERGLVVDGRRIGHLLDPRTGRPAPDFGSLTVWAPTALEADCLATGLYVLGPDAALAWAEAHPGIEVVVARAEGDGVILEATPGIEPKLEILAGNAEVVSGRGRPFPPGGRERDRGIGGRSRTSFAPGRGCRDEGGSRGREVRGCGGSEPLLSRGPWRSRQRAVPRTPRGLSSAQLRSIPAHDCTTERGTTAVARRRIRAGTAALGARRPGVERRAGRRPGDG